MTSGFGDAGHRVAHDWPLHGSGSIDASHRYLGFRASGSLIGF